MEYVVPDWLKDFNGQPPPFQGSSGSRPGGSATGTSQWGGSWGPTPSPAPTSQGGGAIMGGGIGVPEGGGPISWLPVHRGLIGGRGVRGNNY